MYLRDIPHHYTIVKVQELKGIKNTYDHRIVPSLGLKTFGRSPVQAVRNHRVVARLHVRRIALMSYDFLIN